MLFRTKAWVVSTQCRRGSRPCPHHLTSTGGWVWFDGDFPRISQGSICEIEISSKQHKNVKIRPVGNRGYAYPLGAVHKWRHQFWGVSSPPPLEWWRHLWTAPHLKNGANNPTSHLRLKKLHLAEFISKFCVTEVSIRTCHKWEMATRIWMNQIHIFESHHTLSGILLAHWEKLWWGLAIVTFFITSKVFNAYFYLCIW